jgi:hypothetical protein
MRALTPEINLKQIYLFWNMVVAGSSRQLFKHYEKVIKDNHIPLLKTAIPRSLRYAARRQCAGVSVHYLSAEQNAT